MPRAFLRFSPVLLLAIAGCSDTTTDPSQGLIAAPVSPVIDIPVPAGFHMAGDSQTFIAPNQQLRMAHIHMKGNDDYLSVARFFREQLPLKGWTLLSQTQNGQTVIQSYSKPAEDLTITVTEGILNTHAYIKLDPANRSTPATPTPPQ